MLEDGGEADSGIGLFHNRVKVSNFMALKKKNQLVLKNLFVSKGYTSSSCVALVAHAIK